MIGGIDIGHDYYYYTKEEWLESLKIPVFVMDDKDAVFQTMHRKG